MRPCPCSIRALDIFVKDFAGVSIKPSHARPFLHQRRTRSSQAPLRQLEALARSPVRAGPLGKVQTKEFNCRELDEAWHSDSPISAPASAAVQPVGDGIGGKGLHEEFQAAEDVSLKSEEAAIARVGRTLNRLQRKKRRKEDGSWKPVAKGLYRREGPSEDGDAVQGPEVDELAVDGKTRDLKKMSKPPLRVKSEGLKNVSAAMADKEAETETSAPRTRRGRTRESIRVGKNAAQSDLANAMKAVAKKHIAPKSQPPSTKVSAEKAEKTAKPTPQWRKKDREPWQIQKAALGHKFGEQGWQPNKRLSPDTLEGIRALHVSDPRNYNTETLAQHFHITPEAIRRILKSKWRPNEEEAEERRLRWEKRGVKKWSEMAELGIRPPAKWRALGVKSKEQEGKRVKGSQGRKREEVLWDIGDEAVGVGVGGESFAGRIL